MGIHSNLCATEQLARAFAGKVLIESLKTKKKVKDFLKEHHKETIADLLHYSDREIAAITCKHLRKEVSDLKQLVTRWGNKKVTFIGYSKNIPPPPRDPTKEERSTLLAVLVAEPLFGNRKGITAAKQRHLPRLYAPIVQSRGQRALAHMIRFKKYSIAS